MGRPKGSGRPLKDRLWDKVNKETENGCWLWTGTINKDGYGKIGSGGSGGKILYVHRASYELANGPISVGLQVDHVCHTQSCGKTGRDCLHRRCVNPIHLEAVSHRDNSLRDGCTNSGKNVLKTHCPAGHEYDEVNTRKEKNRHGLLCRKCRVCDRDRAKTRRQRNGK